jgi:hypothetical protein
MRIADLDIETRRLIAVAHLFVMHPTEEGLGRLIVVVREFDQKHDA